MHPTNFFSAACVYYTKQRGTVNSGILVIGETDTYRTRCVLSLCAVRAFQPLTPSILCSLFDAAASGRVATTGMPLSG